MIHSYASQRTYIARFADVRVGEALLGGVVEGRLSAVVTNSQQVSSHVALRSGDLCSETRKVNFFIRANKKNIEKMNLLKRTLKMCSPPGDELVVYFIALFYCRDSSVVVVAGFV